MKPSGRGPNKAKRKAKAKAKPKINQTSSLNASLPTTSSVITEQASVITEQVSVITKQASSSRKIGFLGLPREVRDRIYEELFISKFSKKDQADYDAIASGNACSNHGNAYRQMALDKIDQKYAFNPSNRKGNPFVVQAKGLLFANKQIYEEATTILYSKNEWLVLIDGEILITFWNCGKGLCSFKEPCIVSEGNLVKIQYITLVVHNERARDDPQIESRYNITKMLIAHFVKVLKERNMNLKMLRVRYTNRFVGQIEDVRESLEGNSSLHPRSVVIRDIHGVVEQYFRNVPRDIFKHCDVLEPLTGLEGRVEDIDIFGDLPKAYINKLTRIIRTKEPTAVVLKARKKADILKAQAKEKRKGVPGSAAEFVQHKAKDEPEFEDMANRMPKFSPLMIDQMMSHGPASNGFLVVDAAPPEGAPIGSAPSVPVHIDFGPSGNPNTSNATGPLPFTFGPVGPPPF